MEKKTLSAILSNHEFEEPCLDEGKTNQPDCRTSVRHPEDLQIRETNAVFEEHRN